MQGHSAHIGQEVVVHYRWHPLYGRRVRQQYAEKRAGGDVVHLEVAPGVVTVVAAWMLDPLACAGMELGAPRVTLAALRDLHTLLVGLRPASGVAPWTMRPSSGRSRMKPSRPKPSSEARQLGLALDSVKLGGMSLVERQRALRLLATLPIEAAGLAAEGRARDRD